MGMAFFSVRNFVKNANKSLHLKRLNCLPAFVAIRVPLRGPSLGLAHAHLFVPHRPKILKMPYIVFRKLFRPVRRIPQK
jgi:hypothetical protein